MSGSPSEITELLIDWNNGNQSALERLLPLVEKELHRLAHTYMKRESPNHLLQTTALVNEAYLKLIDQRKTRWQNRAHFFGIAAQIMRRILLNYARDQRCKKRGGGAAQVSLSEVALISHERTEEIIVLDEALEKLAKVDARKAKVIELRYFGGLNNREISEVLAISEITVVRDVNFATAWLMREIECQSTT